MASFAACEAATRGGCSGKVYAVIKVDRDQMRDLNRELKEHPATSNCAGP